ncbi:DUF551 domain-containing protein [Xenorhabdus budapestensis]|uniref:DUF551 domain-containing protein n=1 Tax=Xenorhabdus budapestensis TaxID=290110 RepID=UPI003A853D9C
MEWIKLSDNRPPYGKYLVLYLNSSKEYKHSVVTFCGVTRSIYSDKLIDTWYITPGGGAQLYEPEISYWMPLPQPPTGE